MFLEEVFGWIGVFFNILIYLSPTISFIKIYKGKLDYEDAPTIFIVTTYCNCLIWYIFGILVLSEQVKYCSIIGCYICTIFIIIYLIYEIREFIADTILNALLLFTGTLAVYRVLSIIFPDSGIVGKLGIFTTLIYLLYPLLLIYRVTKVKNYQLIPIFLPILNILSSICWIIYCSFIEENYLIIAHSLIIFVGIYSCLIRQYYKIKFPTIEQTKEIATIGIESTGTEEKKIETNIQKVEEENDDDKIKIKPVKIITKKDKEENVN